MAYKNRKRETMYRRWYGIKRRTTDKRCNVYKYYGGRGIRMWREWLKSFDKFYAYMGDPPGPDHTIDRIDNDGHYEPGNVKWSTWREQNANKRNNNRPSFRRNLSTGYMGVQRAGKKFSAKIGHKGRLLYLGLFERPEEAHYAYQQAARQIVETGVPPARHRT